MDMDALMTQQGMRAMTEEQRDTWTNDAVQIRQIAQVIQARLTHTHIDGDGTGTASRRARKVVRPLTQAARLLEKAAARMEAANALYLREVLELPDRRAKELARKEKRRERLGIAAAAAKDGIAGSLAQSTTTLHHGPTPVGNPQVTPAGQPQPVYTNPAFHMPPTQAGRDIPSIGDLFDQAAG
jgi:hypothetical protein